jgi:hypothetical protein
MISKSLYYFIMILIIFCLFNFIALVNKKSQYFMILKELLVLKGLVYLFHQATHTRRHNISLLHKIIKNCK